MKIKAVIFDLDGTLINSLDDLADSMNTALVEHSLPAHPVEDYKMMIGNGATVQAMRAAGSDDQAVYEPVLLRMRQLYELSATHKTRVYDGIAQLVSILKERKIKLAVLTNKYETFAIRLIDHFFPAGTFDYVWGSGPRGAVKPDPAALKQLLEEMDVPPPQVLFIGDSGVDMQVARAGETIAIGVTWGFRSVDELKNNGAFAIIDRPTQILDFLY